MKEIVDQLYQDRVAVLADSHKNNWVVCDLSLLERFKTAKVGSTVVLVSNEAMLERCFSTIPEVYYQLLENSQKPVDVRLEHKASKELLEIEIKIVSNSTLQNLINRYKKPLALYKETQLSNLNPEFKLPLPAEIKSLSFDELFSEHRSLIKFFSDGAFKLLKK